MMDVDILIAGDFRFPGGTSTSIASEARALAVAGYRVGLLALATGPLAPRRPIHAEIRALDDAGLARLVPQNEPVQAQLCCLHHPLAFSVLPAVPPLVTCRHCILVVHHPAVDAFGAAQYDVPAVIAITAALFGPTLWAPVGPKVRVTLENLPEPPPIWFRFLCGIVGSDWTNLPSAQKRPPLKEKHPAVVPLLRMQPDDAIRAWRVLNETGEI